MTLVHLHDRSRYDERIRTLEETRYFGQLVR